MATQPFLIESVDCTLKKFVKQHQNPGGRMSVKTTGAEYNAGGKVL